MLCLPFFIPKAAVYDSIIGSVTKRIDKSIKISVKRKKADSVYVDEDNLYFGFDLVGKK